MYGKRLIACNVQRYLARLQHDKASSSVNAQEMANFGRLSDQWWDLNGSFQALHSMNKLRTELIREGVATNRELRISNSPLEGLKILDVGCGGGILAEALARMGAEVTGLDACPEAISAARDHASRDRALDGRLSYVVGTAEEHETDAYDAVVASEIIEHVTDPNEFLHSCSKLVKEDGSLFVTTINRTPLSWLLAIVAAERILRIVPQGMHEWNKFIKPEEVGRILLTHGFMTVSVKGMSYTPFVDSWNWTRDTSVNYALHARKLL